MAHNHSHHNHGHCHNHYDSSSNLKLAFFLNLFFTIIEFVGGILTNSVAIIADSLHDLGDSLSLGLAWIMEKYSKKGRSEKFSYGYKRFSLLAAFINAIILIFGSIFVLSQAIPRLLNPESSNYTGMLLLAILGIAVNGAAVLRLKRGSSLNERVISWHLLEDVFGWAAVLIISIVNMIKEMPILDPLLAAVFTAVILYNVIKNLKKISAVFLQSTPSHVTIEELEKKIMKIKGVLSVHDTHLWTIDDENHVMTVHVVVKDKIPLSKLRDIKCKVRKTAACLNIQHSTIEMEEEHEKCEYLHC